MKKYLTIICVLLTLTAFVSCGDSTSSSDSSELESSISETATEETTEPETKEINPILDSVFENDYLKISVSSDWEESDSTLGDTYYTEWDWKENDSLEHYILLDFTEDSSGNMSKEDLIKFCSENEEVFIAPNSKIIDSFEKNNQAYVITENTENRQIVFISDKVKGKIIYLPDDEDIVMDMIESIEFNDNISENSADDVSENSVELDSDWECDYLKIGTCSDWEEDSQMNGKSFTAIWNWEDSDVYHFISLTLDESSMGKMSQSDLQEFYEEYFKYSSNENNYEIIDNFMEDKQAYIVIGNEELPLWNIHFSTDTVQGDFTYTSQDEDIVRNMIETIEFY